MIGDAKPHFTTIADFVSRSREAIAAVFAQVPTLLDGEGLIGREGLLAFPRVDLTNVGPDRASTASDQAKHPTTWNHKSRSRRVTIFSCRRSGRLSIRKKGFFTASTFDMSGRLKRSLRLSARRKG